METDGSPESLSVVLPCCVNLARPVWRLLLGDLSRPGTSRGVGGGGFLTSGSPPASESGRGEWDYLNLHICPWRPRGPGTSPASSTSPFQGLRRSRAYLHGQGEKVEFVLDVHPDYRGLGITGLA